jgi:hypothetical protein
MEPSGPTSGIPQTPLNRLQPVSLQWQVGQQLHATVLENSAGKILLTIGNRQLSAESSLPFEPGQVLNLQVRSVGQQPVLRVIAALQESATAMAVRMLLPRYGPTTPLLASLSQLATTTSAPLPPVITAIARTLVCRLPDVAAVSTPQGVKAAIRNSGSFLEHHLALAADTKAAVPVPVSFDSDFKANLLRLLQLVRNWPGDSQAASTPATPRPESGAAAPGPATRAAAPPSPEATGNRPATASPPAATTAAPAGTPAPQPAAAPPPTLQRAIDSAALPLPPRAAAAATNTGMPASGSANVTVNAAPPFAGVVPAAQAPVQATIELLNRLGNLRLDLLQQTEAAVARIHLNQLASLPREAEHRLVEWLFDIPVRRGDAIDLWSARIYRDADDKTQAKDQPAAQWRIQLAFDLPGLGPMQAEVSLRGERVSTHFWASQANTLPLLREHLHELRRGMLAAGLEVGEIDCQQGNIPDSASGPLNPLINEQA